MDRLVALRSTLRPLIVIASAMLVLAASLLLVSELLRLGPSNVIDGWADKHDVVTFSQWDEATGVLHAAAVLNPVGPDAWLDLAKLTDWRATVSTGAAAAKYREQAIDFYLAAIERRPRYGAAWALLAKNYWQAGRFVPHGVEAWRRCLQLAPYEHDTSALLVMVGLVNWKQLSERDRTDLVGLLRYRRQRHERLLLPIEKTPLVLQLIEHGSLESVVPPGGRD